MSPRPLAEAIGGFIRMDGTGLDPVELPTPTDPRQLTMDAALGRSGSPLGERRTPCFLCTGWIGNWVGSWRWEVVEGMGNLGDANGVTERR